MAQDRIRGWEGVCCEAWKQDVLCLHQALSKAWSMEGSGYWSNYTWRGKQRGGLGARGSARAVRVGPGWQL